MTRRDDYYFEPVERLDTVVLSAEDGNIVTMVTTDPMVTVMLAEHVTVAVFLAATTAGTSTTTGTLTATTSLTATAAGASTTTGTITPTRALAATTAGASTTAGALTATVSLAATTAGTSATTGTATRLVRVEAATAGTSTTTGTITATVSLAATTAGTSTTSGTVTATMSLAATSAGTSTTSGTVTATMSLAATTAGSATTSGTLADTITELLTDLNALAWYRSSRATPTSVPDALGLASDLTHAAGTNSPLTLPHRDEPYIRFEDTAGHYISMPDAAALDITGDIDIRARVALDDWTPSHAQTVAGKYLTTGDQRSWLLDINTNGTIRLFWSPDGTLGARITATSTAAVTAASGEALWIRATLDVDNGASGYDATFYTSTNGSTWTQLGSTVTGGATTSIHSGTATLELGDYNVGTSGTDLVGRLYDVELRSGIAGTLVADFDAALAGTTGYTDSVGSHGGVWTITLAKLVLAGDYVRIPGTASNFVRVLTGLSYDPESDWVFVWDGSLDTGANQLLWDGRTPSSGGPAVYVNGSNSLSLVAYTPSYTAFTGVSVASYIGRRVRIRVEYTADIGGGTRQVVYKAKTTFADDLSADTGWTTLSTVTGSNTWGTSAGNHRAGHIPSSAYGADLYGAAAWQASATTVGTPYAHFSPSSCGQSGYTDAVGSAGATWSVERATSGRKTTVVKQGTLLLGTDDYLDIPADAWPAMTATDSCCVLVRYRRWDTSGSTDRIFAAGTSETTPTFTLISTGNTTLTARIGGTTNQANITTLTQTAGTINVAGIAVNARTAWKGRASGSSVAGSSPAAITTTLGQSTPRVGARSDSTAGFVDAELLDLIPLQSYPTDAQLDTLETLLALT